MSVKQLRSCRRIHLSLGCRQNKQHSKEEKPRQQHQLKKNEKTIGRDWEGNINQ